MGNQKKYWKSDAELNPESDWVTNLQHKEFVEKLPEDAFLGDKETLESSATSRRDFLKYVGFSTAAASLAACEGPVYKSIPYVVQPEEIRPGVANYYATTIADGFDFASILIKTREGRPIKVENNTDAQHKGHANARVQASVLSMYDSLRLQGPTQAGMDVSWSTFTTNTKKELASMLQAGDEVVLLTQSFASPTTQKIISDFQAKYPNVRHVVYDAVSESAALNAFEKAYGRRALPTYDFAKAAVIVSVGGDILGDWQGGGHESGYAKGRIPHKSHGKAVMSKHYQFESNMSLSGANADVRVPITPAAQAHVLAAIYEQLTGIEVSVQLEPKTQKAVNRAVAQLKVAGSKGIVVTGLQTEEAQRVALAINEFLLSKVIDTNVTTEIRQGDADAVNKVIEGLSKGSIKGIITAGINPAYTLPNAATFVEAVKKAKLSIAFSMKKDETALATQWVAATPHFLESWGDVSLSSRHFSLVQPTIKPLFDTKQFQDVLLSWLDSGNSYRDEIKLYWTNSILNGNSWNKALHDGFFTAMSDTSTIYSDNVLNAVEALKRSQHKGLALNLYTKTGIGDGQQANNPWLQEFPDPITRISWDNYLTVSKADAASLDLYNVNQSDGALDGSYVKIRNGKNSLIVPVLIQPGQAVGTVGLALGYGKTAAVKTEMQIGVNAYSLYHNFDLVQEVNLEPVSGNHEFACTQLHNTLMGRGDIVKETHLEIFNTKDVKYWNPVPVVSKNHIETPVTSPEVDMWEEFDRSIGHHFNLSIDLNACTGCGACVIACHAENNVPVVGKREIRKSRDMHWLRIDRYYSAEETFEQDLNTKDNISSLGESLSTFGEMEDPSSNPQVTFQPVMCQHCNHAPCETVCPVAATSHGRQGQNHMAYNRCVGTRYCANNCPYKVRRFNWFLYNQNDEFDYYMNNDLGRMVLNPDVVVRSRGVMEKCSLCIQKTQKTILDAKLKGREIQDGEFQTACSSACGNEALVFGDINDKESRVAELKENDRMYHLLESIGTKPNVMYQVKVRNNDIS